MTDNYRAVLEQARHAFVEKDPAAMAQACGAGMQLYPPYSLREIILPYLGQFYRAAWPTGEVTKYGSQDEASLPASLVILHYLCRGRGTLPTGKWIGFPDLWGGQSFRAAFESRALQPLGKIFHQRWNLFAASMEQLGGRPARDFAKGYLLFALPRVPVLCLLNPGDEEVPTRGNLLFDATANDYLETEDLAVLGEMLTLRLTRLVKNDQNG